MKNRFAAFLFAGKIAALPLFAKESFGTVKKIQNEIVSKEASIVKKQGLSNIEFSTFIKLKSEENTDLILLNDDHYRQPTCTLNLVLTGLRYKDEVLVAVSNDKDDPASLKVDPRLRIGLQNLTTLTSFCVLETPIPTTSFPIHKLEHTVLRRTETAISLPVDIHEISELTAGESPTYLQVLAAPNSNWDWSNVRYSDLLNIEKTSDQPMAQSVDEEDSPCYSS